MSTQAKLSQAATISYAASLGWTAPEHVDSLDYLEHEAKRWLDRWGQDALERMSASPQLELDWEKPAMNVNKYQETALDIYLSEWPRDWEYAEIIELVAAGKSNEYVTPWEPFENMDSDRLAGEIESTVDLLEMRFEPRKKGA